MCCRLGASNYFVAWSQLSCRLQPSRFISIFGSLKSISASNLFCRLAAKHCAKQLFTQPVWGPREE